MALNKAGLDAAILALVSNTSNTPAQFATGLADAIDTYVKTATVNVASVSGVTAGGAVSGPGTGTLS